MYLRYCLRGIIVVGLLGAVIMHAQFQLPTKNSYEHTLPTVIHVGESPQVRTGGVATLGVQLIPSTQTDANWIQSIRGSASGVPAFVTDSSIAVQRHSIPTLDIDWQSSASNFGFDTNAPISVNGLWSERDISTSEPIETETLSLDSIKESPLSQPQIPMCVDISTGAISLCDGVSKPIITFTSSPNTISSGDTVRLNWVVSNATECHALAGNGFFTSKDTSGSDTSNAINSPAGARENFIIACTNDMGVMSFKSLTVSVQ
jgi:hypothetical protein